MRTFRYLLFVPLAAMVMAGCNPKDESDAGQGNLEVKDDPIVTSGFKTEPDAGDEVAVFETEFGTIVFMFHPEKAPGHVARFKELISSGFYDGTRFHRCIPGMMIQGGDPLSKDIANSDMWGTGGATDEAGREINIPAEFNSMRHVRGVVSTARGQSDNSASSQFFLMHDVFPSLDGKYTAFGRIVSGMSVVDNIVLTGNSAGEVAPDLAVVLTRAYLTTWPIEGSD